MKLYNNTSVIQDKQAVSEVVRPSWSPAQIVALLIGTMFVVLGAVGLARTGLHFKNIAATLTSVMGMHQTSVSSLIEIGAGVILLLGGLMVNASRAVMSLIGVVTFVFGIIIAIQPASFASSVGFDRANGVFLILVGIVLGIASNVLPLISRGSSISTFSKTNDSTTQQTGLVGAEPIISK